ncbi:hypothetical protein C0991_010733 [Blastosporella zonata]|nr:hypothetical protein C0991_010733 [Blastosporella zonata]
MNVLYRRVESSRSGSIDPVSVAGLCIAGGVVLGMAIWLFIAVLRKRASAKRRSIRNGAFLSVRGLVNVDAPSLLEKTPVNPPAFPRQDVTLPDRVLQRPTRVHTPDDVINYHRQSGTFPKPFSFALSAASGPPSRPGRGDQSRQSASLRESIFSVSTGSRFSVHSSNSSVDTNPTTGTARKVRQIFDPVLPDELLIRAGESLTLVQSFDDGWCIVGRENSTLVANAKSLFRPNTVAGDGIELGVVPAWCFIRHAPGLRAERPIRSTSLGITVRLNAHETAPRDNIISWSNF